MNKIYTSKFIFTILFFMSIPNCAIAQQGTWTQKANLGNIGRARSFGFSIGTKGYIGTGANGPDLMDFWEYDPQSDTWTQKANLGTTGRALGVGFSIGNKGYAGLGIANAQPQSDFWEYNPQNNSWTTKATYPGTGKIATVGFAIGAFGYIGTGSIISTTGNESKQFWQYNPATDSWIQKADFPGNKRDRAVGFSLLSKGYIGTGYQGINPSALGDFWEYNPATDSWIQKATVPELQRVNGVGFSTGSKGYIGMGYGKTDFWQYSPNTDSWLQMATFSGTTRIFATGFAIGNKGYFGTGSYTTTYYKDFWVYEEQLLGVNQHDFPNRFEVYPNPASDFINLPPNEEIIETIVYNIQGKQLLKTSYTCIDISNIPLGFYYLKITTSHGVLIKKFIKN